MDVSAFSTRRADCAGGADAVATMTLTDTPAKKTPEAAAEKIVPKEQVRLAGDQSLSLTGPEMYYTSHFPRHMHSHT